MLLVAAGCLLALAIVLFVLPAATYTAKVPHDIPGYFDAMHRLHMGQQPHVDFHTPIGWLPYLGHLALDQFGGTLEFGNVLILAILLPSAAVALHGRVPTGPGMLLLSTLFAVVSVPWPLGESGMASTQVAHYNRWGWALLLFGLPVREAGGKRVRHPSLWVGVESTVIAALLFLLFFAKATYFVIGLAFVLLFGVALGRFRRTGAWGLVPSYLWFWGCKGSAVGWMTTSGTCCAPMPRQLNRAWRPAMKHSARWAFCRQRSPRSVWPSWPAGRRAVQTAPVARLAVGHIHLGILRRLGD